MLDVDGVLVRNESDDFVRNVALDATLATARSRVKAEQWLALGTGQADLFDVLDEVMRDRDLAERLVEYGMASETHSIRRCSPPSTGCAPGASASISRPTRKSGGRPI